METANGKMGKGQKRTRSRTGCINCRRKKKKCDETKPTCRNCVKTSERCQWIRPLSFRPEYSSFVDDQTSEPSCISSKEPQLRLDEVAENLDTVINDNNSTIDNNETGGSHRRTTRATTLDSELTLHQQGLTESHSSATSGAYIRFSDSNTSTPPSSVPLTSQPLSANLNKETRHYPSASNPKLPDAAVSLLPTDMEANATMSAADLGDGLTHDQSGTLSARDCDFQLSPDIMTDDGIFLPGSKYQELHNTLRDHVFHTARSAEVSRQATPPHDVVPVHGMIGVPFSHLDPSRDFDFTEPRSLVESSGTDVDLTPNQEYILWKNWVVEISAWASIENIGKLLLNKTNISKLDKMDGDKHFRHTLPTIAKTCPHLRYSMLALSARQLERRDGSLPASMSLALYQEAIHLLLPELHNRDVAVIASCVILCVLEMQSCSPRAWRRHLDGCACLIRAMNIRGDSGGVEQALFWCFARMDLCGGLISRGKTLIPVDEWMSPGSFEANRAPFTSSGVFEVHAQYACYLVATVLDFLKDAEAQKNYLSWGAQQTYSSKWSEIFTCLEDWYDYRPPEMQEVLSHNAAGAPDGTKSPFPTLLFSNGAAISGNQLYHTAALLMLQQIPPQVPKKSRSMLWHARKICAIAISNDHHGSWTNSVQPLWLAGQVMSHPDEHRAIVNIYERIEKETGWGATWRTEDLKKYWGNLDD